MSDTGTFVGLQRCRGRWDGAVATAPYFNCSSSNYLKKKKKVFLQPKKLGCFRKCNLKRCCNSVSQQLKGILALGIPSNEEFQLSLCLIFPAKMSSGMEVRGCCHFKIHPTSFVGERSGLQEGQSFLSHVTSLFFYKITSLPKLSQHFTVNFI